MAHKIPVNVANLGNYTIASKRKQHDAEVNNDHGNIISKVLDFTKGNPQRYPLVLTLLSGIKSGVEFTYDNIPDGITVSREEFDLCVNFIKDLHVNHRRIPVHPAISHLTQIDGKLGWMFSAKQVEGTWLAEFLTIERYVRERVKYVYAQAECEKSTSDPAICGPNPSMVRTPTVVGEGTEVFAITPSSDNFGPCYEIARAYCQAISEFTENSPALWVDREFDWQGTLWAVLLSDGSSMELPPEAIRYLGPIGPHSQVRAVKVGGSIAVIVDASIKDYLNESGINSRVLDQLYAFGVLLYQDTAFGLTQFAKVSIDIDSSQINDLGFSLMENVFRSISVDDHGRMHVESAACQALVNGTINTFR